MNRLVSDKYIISQTPTLTFDMRVIPVSLKKVMKSNLGIEVCQQSIAEVSLKMNNHFKVILMIVAVQLFPLTLAVTLSMYQPCYTD